MRRALKLCSSPVSGFPLGTSMHRVAEGRLLFRIYKGYLVEGGRLYMLSEAQKDYRPIPSMESLPFCPIGTV